MFTHKFHHRARQANADNDNDNNNNNENQMTNIDRNHTNLQGKPLSAIKEVYALLTQTQVKPLLAITITRNIHVALFV